MKRQLLLGPVAALLATAALAQSPSSSTLTEPQRVRVQQNVLGALGSPRDDNATFALTLGTAVPDNVELADVTETLRDIQPDWRGRKFFVVKNTVVIVDQNRKISAVLPVGDARANARRSTVSRSTPSVQPLSGKAAIPGTAGSTPGSIGTATTPSVPPLNNSGQASSRTSPLSNSNANAQAPASRASAPGQVTTPPAITHSAPGSSPGSSSSGSSGSSSSGSSSN